MNQRMLTFLGTTLCLLGCAKEESPAPNDVKVVPATGTVEYADGSPVALGAIEFRPLDGAGANGMGAIENGAFQLRFLQAGGAVDGVPPGEYKVTVTLMDSGSQQQGAPETIAIPDTVTIEDGEATIALTLPEQGS